MHLSHVARIGIVSSVRVSIGFSYALRAFASSGSEVRKRIAILSQPMISATKAAETSGGMSFLGPLWEREQVKKRLVRTL